MLAHTEYSVKLKIKIVDSAIIVEYAVVMAKNRIKKLRLRAGIRQSDLARIVGCTPTSLWKIENDVSNPSMALASRIAIELRCTIEDLGIFRKSVRSRLIDITGKK